VCTNFFMPQLLARIFFLQHSFARYFFLDSLKKFSRKVRRREGGHYDFKNHPKFLGFFFNRFVVHDIFFLDFCCARIFFWYLPPSPLKYLIVRPLPDTYLLGNRMQQHANVKATIQRFNFWKFTSCIQVIKIVLHG
jgi:hypothetical protein